MGDKAATGTTGQVQEPGGTRAPRDGLGGAAADGVREHVAVKAVVLDVGNVILAWEAQAAVAGRVTTRAWEEFVLGADFHALNSRFDAGDPFEQVVADLARAHPERPDWVTILRTYRDHHLDSLPGLVPGMKALVEELLATGVPLYALTNFEADLFDNARHLIPALERFDGVVVSGREHLVKPDLAIYRLMLERYDLAPGRTLFVDDSPANVAAAQTVGLETHRFTGVGRLRAELVERGVLRAPLD